MRWAGVKPPSALFRACRGGMGKRLSWLQVQKKKSLFATCPRTRVPGECDKSGEGFHAICQFAIVGLTVVGNTHGSEASLRTPAALRLARSGAVAVVVAC